MAWQEGMRTILRSLIGDMTEPFTNSDDNLEQVLAVAAFRVLQDGLAFSQDFRSFITTAKIKITPDPTSEATRDDSFVNLTCLKAACMMDQSSAVVAARQAIAVKDGSSAVDLRGIIAGKLKLLEKGWCAVYDDAKLEFQTGQSVAGAAVMTPFRLFAQGSFGPSMWYDERNRQVII